MTAATLPDGTSICTDVLRAIGANETIARLEPHLTTKSPWPEVAAYDVTTDSGARLRFSCRYFTYAHPVDCIDFIEMDSDPAVHLVIIYLGAEHGRIDPVPDPFILADEWLKVTHVYWDQSHDFAPAPPFSPGCRDTPEALRLAQETRTTGTTPRLSVITIVYNGEPLLEQSIQSVLLNKGSDVEYIIVDGNSSDGTLEIINRYRDHVDCWISEPDRGIYDALNKGIDLCHGEFIGAIHANDLYATSALAHIRHALDVEPDADFIYGRLTYIDAVRQWEAGKRIESTRELVIYGNFNHPTCFVRRETYERLGRFRQHWSIAGDYELGIRFWNAGARFRYVDALIAHFRRGGTSANLFRNQWQRHRIRVESGQPTGFSLLILALVIVNYYIKRPLRGALDAMARTRKPAP